VESVTSSDMGVKRCPGLACTLDHFRLYKIQEESRKGAETPIKPQHWEDEGDIQSDEAVLSR